MSREKEKAYLAAIIPNILLAYAYVSGKILLEKLTPFQLLLARFLLAYFSIYFISFRDRKSFQKKEELFFAAAGLGNYLSLWMNYVALGYTTATNVGILGAIVPLITGLFGYIFLKEKQLDRFFWSGCVLAIFGVSVIYLKGEGIEIHVIGDTIMLINGVVTAFYSVFVAKINQSGCSAFVASRKINFYSLLYSILFYAVSGDSKDWSGLMDGRIIWNLMLLGVGASAVCLASFSYAIKVLGIGKSGIFSYLCVIMSVIFASTILKDELNWRVVTSAVLILSGTILSEKGKQILTYKKQMI